jgi:tRNA pseudouridine38-40 synthase
MPNYSLNIEYDGTDFVGWQRQTNGRSVQEEVERALQEITRNAVTLTGAGRTDAGVHARGQVANFLTGSALSANDFFRALNGMLPDDIAVTDVKAVPDDFSARYSARSRCYTYTIARRPSALMRRFSWQLSYEFDIPAMEQAAAIIRGTEDFQAFCKIQADVTHYRCMMEEASWRADDGGFLVFTISANRFLHGMVRAIVGTMVNVGRGYTPLEEFSAIILSHDRRRAGQAAPARGLCLERVIY